MVIMLAKLTCFNGQELEKLVTIGLIVVFLAYLWDSWPLGVLLKLSGRGFMDKMCNTLHFRMVYDKNQGDEIIFETSGYFSV